MAPSLKYLTAGGDDSGNGGGQRWSSTFRMHFVSEGGHHQVFQTVPFQNHSNPGTVVFHENTAHQEVTKTHTKKQNKNKSKQFNVYSIPSVLPCPLATIFYKRETGMKIQVIHFIENRWNCVIWGTWECSRSRETRKSQPLERDVTGSPFKWRSKAPVDQPSKVQGETGE